LLAGQIDWVMDQIPASIGHVRGGRLRAIAVTTDKRAAQLPDTPTLAELGVKDFSATTPIMLMAPAGTPPAIVNKLNETVADALADPAVKDKPLGLGAAIAKRTAPVHQVPASLTLCQAASRPLARSNRILGEHNDQYEANPEGRQGRKGCRSECPSAARTPSPPRPAPESGAGATERVRPRG
jgi:hypothetical protein